MLTDLDLEKIRTKHFGPDAGEGPFVEAVLRHLIYSLPAPAGAVRAEQAAAAIAGLARGEEGIALLDDPQLLASLFQNADLLDPSQPSAARILAGVMEALASAG